ncbi:MAG TPA: AmmeMemoRadiSam system radical SAM enzyme [Dehalococcoidia bacterium]|nr:AmmeMemoRadiSam system radical SAM enzyme [Dehalococcoidia bacterium]
MAEAILYQRLEGGRVRCDICQWHCNIGPGKYGLCRCRKNEDGMLQVLNYARVSSIAADPVEKKPLYHFYPGTMCLSLGTLGCNFHCLHCQNYHIACVEDPFKADTGLQDITPRDSINLAGKKDCRGIAWTYNEPGIWFEYTLDSARLAKENNLYTVYVTNGYLSPQALDMIGPYLDAWRVDIKGFSDAFYMKLAKVKKWRGILEVAQRARHKWNMHVEVVTNIIPTLNDDERQLQELASWIKNELGELTPWHVTRFYPQYRLQNLPPTPIQTLEKAWNIGSDAGLKFVYVGNVAGHASENTVCYRCGKTVIRRRGYHTEILGVDGSNCSFCSADLNIRGAGVRTREEKS